MGSVAVVAEATASAFTDPRDGEIGVGVGIGCSEVALLIDPALELAAL